MGLDTFIIISEGTHYTITSYNIQLPADYIAFSRNIFTYPMNNNIQWKRVSVILFGHETW